MKKLLTVALSIAFFVMLGQYVNAQAPKFGHINSAELMRAMPETDSIQLQLQNHARELENTIKVMQAELENKQVEYQNNQAQWSDLIKQTKQKELQDMYARTQEFMEQADADLKAKQQELLNPIMESAKNAIEGVAKEGKFSYIFDTSSGAVLYNNESDDIMPLVKKKLGLQ